MKSPYCKQIRCEFKEKWNPVFPELNFIVLKGKLNSLPTLSFNNREKENN
jgi:hypothetical protein